MKSRHPHLVPCPHCEKLIEPTRLKDHLRIHERKVEYKCEICWKVYRDKWYYLKHQNKCGLDEGEVQLRPKHMCQLCGKMLASKDTLKDHEEFSCSKNPTKIRKSRLACHLCSKLIVPRLYNSHILSCTGRKRVRCYFCKRWFSDSHSMYEHLRSVHVKEKPFSCKQCPYKTGRASDIHGHINLTHKKKLVPCYFCGKKYCSPKHAGIHIQTIHLMEKSFKCEKCPKRFKTQAELTRHLKTGGRNEEDRRVHGIPERKDEVECPKCLKVVKPQCLQNHLRKIHDNPNLKPFKCLICSKMFNNKSDCRRHMGTHQTNRKKYPCLECGASFFSKSHLKRHKEIHGNRAKTECPKCGNHVSSEHYNAHITGIHGLVRYSCYFCGRGFNGTGSHVLYGHMLGKHVKEIGCKCPYCSYRTYTHSLILQHLKKHHSSEPRY